MAHSGAGDLDHLVREVYRSHGKEWLAGFAPGILRAAERRDPLACRVVRASALELAEMAGNWQKGWGKATALGFDGRAFSKRILSAIFRTGIAWDFSATEVSILKIPGEVGAARMVAGSTLRVGEKVETERPLVSVETLPTERTNPRSRGLHKNLCISWFDYLWRRRPLLCEASARRVGRSRKQLKLYLGRYSGEGGFFMWAREPVAGWAC